MKKEVMLDLRRKRREAGLSNKDVAHLLDVRPMRVSDIEGGKIAPTAAEACRLCLIYGLELCELLPLATKRARLELRRLVGVMPDEPAAWRRHSEVRRSSLLGLRGRLEAARDPKYGG